MVNFKVLYRIPSNAFNSYTRRLSLKLIDEIQVYICYLRIIKYSKIIFVDIDNTIADTWPTLLISSYSEKERLMNLRYFPDVVDLILKFENDGYKLIFLSARKHSQFQVTKRWLLRVLGNGINFNFYLVSNPSTKLKFLSNSEKSKDVIYVDDLSHSSEKGVTEFYSDLIERIEKMNLTYYDYKSLIVKQRLKKEVYD
jgi:hypothetical protein